MSLVTRRLQWSHGDLEGQHRAIAEAAAILRRGGTVALPTETVYGLGANALDPTAVARIFAAKERPAWDPLIVHIAEHAQLAGVAEGVPRAAEAWMQAYWPGPLTLLLPRAAALSGAVTAGGERVGVRMPRHPVALAVLKAAAVPVAAPSANRFGHVSPTTAEHVLADLDGRIDAVLDAGPCEHGVESTVVDTTTTPCVVYRPGVVTLRQLQAVWPQVVSFQEPSSTTVPGTPLPSPGAGMRHYAPAAELRLVPHQAGQAEALLRAAAETGAGLLGVLLPAGLLVQPLAAREDLVVCPWGEWAQLETLAQQLFAGLRTLDAAGAQRIICPLPTAQGIGVAICDRLRKAAMKR